MSNITTTTGKAIVVGTMGGEALSALYDLRWMLVLIVVLILADFWFGVSESLRKREHFRFSRAGRRTCNKGVDYLTYLMLGSVLGLAIFEPLGWATHTTTAAVGLGFGCVWEMDSIVGHVCALHGIRNRFSVKRFIIALIKKKDDDVGEAVEEAWGDDTQVHKN
jgi:hypothetical protein|nr:MAG TPA: holin [Caudoviricetes sp.]